jgi:4-amino-4-deoxy-L-arabinose transferase-like glycosyltransferase
MKPLPYKALLAVALFALGLFFSLYRLTESPAVWYDEGFYIQSAANLAEHGSTGLILEPHIVSPSTRFITVGYPLIYPLALWFKLFGAGVLQARAFMAIIIMAFLGLAYALSRRLFGEWQAIAVLALLVTFPPLYANGKSVLGEVPGLVFLSISFICLAVFLEKRRTGWLASAGFAAGLCVATKPFFLLILPAMLWGAIVAWRRKEIALRDAGICLAFLLVPIILWAGVQFSGDSISGILAFYANPYSIHDLGTIVAKNLKALVTDTGPLYMVLIHIVWLWSLWKRRRAGARVSIAETISVAFSVLMILAFLRTEGWYRYLFESQILGLIFLPQALDALAPARWRAAGVPIAVALLSLAGLYQTMFHSWVADAYGNHRTAFWQDYFRGVKPEEKLFFFDTPEVAIFAPSDDYYQFMSEGGGTLGTDPMTIVRTASPDRIFLKTYVYEHRKETVFRDYQPDAAGYDYSILVKKPR